MRSSDGDYLFDRGTAYGEDDYHGHRLSHPVVWNVPYAEFILPRIDRKLTRSELEELSVRIGGTVYLWIGAVVCNVP